MSKHCEICKAVNDSVEMRPDASGLMRMLCVHCSRPVFADGTAPGKTTIAELANAEALTKRIAKLEAELQTAHLHLALVLSFVSRVGGFVSADDQTTLQRARNFAAAGG